MTVNDQVLSAHVGDLEGVGEPVRRKWNATVTIAVHDQDESLLANATVTGAWSDGATGRATCTTDDSGTCSVAKTNLKTTVPSVTFTVSTIAHATHAYSPGDNHETSITVYAP